MAVFEGMLASYQEDVASLFSSHVIELVIYDEVERFPQFHDELFNYPFKHRKNIVRSLTVTDVSEVIEDYPYYNQVVEFQKSEVCLEANPFV